MGKDRRSRARRRYAPRFTGQRREAVLKRVYILPNLLTTGNLFFGILAIVRVFEAIGESPEVANIKYVQACWLILFAALLDAFDGLIARLTHTESDFGLNYDSLSDLVSFGLAPATLVLSFLSQDSPKQLVTASCILYIIGGALRLARFNVQAAGEESRSFTGLPIPAAAGAMISCYMAFSRNPAFALKVIPALTALLGILMVTTIPYPSFKSLSLKNRKPFDFLVATVFCAVALHVFDSKELMLLIGFWCYISWGIARFAYAKWRAPEQARHEGEPAALDAPPRPEARAPGTLDD